MARAAQLSLDELDDQIMHTLRWLVPTESGHRARCSCGRISDVAPTKAGARALNLAHVARTPYGRAVYAKLYR